MSLVCTPTTINGLSSAPSSFGGYPETGGGPGYPGHRDCWKTGIRHGGTDGLIRVELGYPHTNFDRQPRHNKDQKSTPRDVEGNHYTNLEKER